MDKISLTTNASHARLLMNREGAVVNKQVKTPPTLTGPMGKAWLVDVEEQAKRLPLPTPHSSIALWLIEAPWAHPLWHSYILYVIHLRPMGVPEDKGVRFYREGATHEIVLFALDPEMDREAALRDCRLFARLEPKNYADQLVEESDEVAAERVRATVQDIIDGKLSPDTDHQRDWIARFGGHMMKKEFRS